MPTPEEHLSNEVGAIVRELDRAIGPGVEVMVVGAVCRDALHLEHGLATPLRATDDVDLALVCHAPGARSVLDLGLDRVSGSGGEVRFHIAGRLVDLVPFGPGVEAPDGVVTVGASGRLSVFGFQDVLRSSRIVDLRGGGSVRLPTVAGYVLLKLKAWVDRSAWHAYKDASDLMVAMHWYAEAKTMTDRLYESDVGLALFAAADYDEPLAAAGLAVDDALRLLTPERRAELAELWPAEADDIALLARYLKNESLPGWWGSADAQAVARRRNVAELVTAVVRGTLGRFA